MNFDLNMSPFRNEACSFCHMPYAGFSGPIPSVNLTMIAYPGTFHFRAGKRTAQRYTYSPRFPVFEFNQTQGAFVGGNFWDARSTGYKLQSADAEQAQHPPVDTQELGFPDTACIALRLSQAEDLCHSRRGGSVRRQRHANFAKSGRPHQDKQCL
jgi:cytochrome c peroxidase